MTIFASKPEHQTSFGRPTEYRVKTVIEKNGYKLEIHLDNKAVNKHMLDNGKLKLFFNQEDITYQINSECSFESLMEAMNFIKNSESNRSYSI